MSSRGLGEGTSWKMKDPVWFLLSEVYSGVILQVEVLALGTLGPGLGPLSRGSGLGEEDKGLRLWYWL